ncbi:MAG: hypothetical protein ACYSWW_12815 [Planctomycetota bacterium]
MGKAVSPAAPDKPDDADIADPGKVAEIKAEQQESKSGKYGSQKITPFKPPAEPEAKAVKDSGPAGKTTKEITQEREEEKRTSWIEIELVGEDGESIPGEKYRITLPDGSVTEGTLDEKGFARVEGFEKGTCKVCLPDIDMEAWELKS